MSDNYSDRIKYENGLLLIKLPKRLDNENSSSFSEAVSEYTKQELKEVRIEASDLRHISPDGLDIILALKLKCPNIIIENARMGICDTLEAYGFTGFVGISKQYRFVSIKDCEIIGHGGHGAIYKVNDDTIIKVYNGSSTLETIENERRFARNAFINGVPTAIAYDVVQTEYGYGVMFEMLGGSTLGHYLAGHPDEIEKYSIKFADLLKKLNSTEADEELYPDFHNIYLDRIEATYRMGFTTKEESDALKRVVLAIPRGTGMIHGDYHPNNVMIDENGELMLIDMADISRGNGFFDIGGAYLILHFINKIPIVSLIAQKITSLKSKECLRLWEIFVRRYYNTEDDEFLKNCTRQFRAFSNIRIVASLGMGSNRPAFLTKLITIYTRKIVVKKAARYEELFLSSMENKKEKC